MYNICNFFVLQVEGASRVSRRFPNSDRNSTTLDKSEDAPPVYRSRVTRRREEIPPRDISRTKSRSRHDVTSSTTETSQLQTVRNERFDLRRQNTRTRSRATISEESFDTTVNRDIQSRNRSRQVTRPVTSQSTQAPLSTTTPTSLTKSEYIDSAFNDIARTSPKEVNDPNSQFKRRSSTARIMEATTPRARNRINTRTNLRALDLEVSGTANTVTTSLKEPTTARSSDLRNSRKLRYKTRQSEIDSNLTGEGLAPLNEVKSSHIKENITSQTGLKSFSRPTTEKVIRQTTERVSKTSTIKTTKVVKRPISRRKVITPIATAKVSEEIREDDNYPETFKALIQAKNASVSRIG